MEPYTRDALINPQGDAMTDVSKFNIVNVKFLKCVARHVGPE